jgi:hypothetical protein
LPERIPPLVNVKPTGKFPVSLQENGARPPFAPKVKTYGTEEVPAGGAGDVLITGPGGLATFKEKVWLALWFFESATVIVKATAFCAVLGVPESVTELALPPPRAMPAGRDPVLTLQE